MDGSGVRSQAWDVSRTRRAETGWYGMGGVMLRDRCSVKRGCRRKASRPSRFVSLVAASDVVRLRCGVWVCGCGLR